MVLLRFAGWRKYFEIIYTYLFILIGRTLIIRDNQCIMQIIQIKYTLLFA